MKNGPTLLLTLLSIILSLILGIHYGKYLKQKDISLAENSKNVQTIKISPPPDSISFTKFTNTDCGFTLTVPETFQAEQQTSTSAILKSNSQIIDFTCNKNTKLPQNAKKPTSLITINNLKVETYKSKELTYFLLDHPIRNNSILFSVSNGLVPLIENSITFTN